MFSAVFRRSQSGARFCLWATGGAVVAVVFCADSEGAGLYRDGASARSMAMGGSTTAIANDPQDALAGNPAALNEIKGPTLEVSGFGGFIHGTFSNSVNDGNVLNNAGALGSIAIAAPAGPFRFALGFSPDIAVSAPWRYRDAPGGADGATTYGVQPQQSSISLLRTSFGISWQAAPTLSLGASVGFLYNKTHSRRRMFSRASPRFGPPRRCWTWRPMDSAGMEKPASYGNRFQPCRWA